MYARVALQHVACTALLCAGAACINVGQAPDSAAAQDTTSVVNADGTSPSAGSNNQALQGNSLVANSGSAGQPNTLSGSPPTGGTTPSQGANPPSTGTQPPAPAVVTGADRFTLVGRFITDNPGVLSLSWLSGKVGVRFTGTSLAIDFSSSGSNRINVVLDGNTLPNLVLKPQSNTTHQVLVSNLPNTSHTLWITKATEFTYGGGAVNIVSWTLDPNCNFYTPPAALPRRIEAIGDSSYSSYGVMGLMGPNGQDCDATSNENADASIPADVAKNLSAEIVNLSVTGAGVLQSQYDSSIDQNHQLPFIYHHLQGGKYSPLWDFHVPMDVVLLSGGGDDIIGESGNGAFRDTGAFVTAYANWMIDVRSHYPKASIYAIMSPNAKNNDRTTMMNALKAAVAQAQATYRGGDPNMLFYDYFANDPNGWTVYDDVANAGGYGWGCSYHTSLRGSQFLADRLAASIKAHMGW